MKRTALIPLLLSLAVAAAQSPEGGTPATIDPMDPSAGDFLDLDLERYLQDGMEAYSRGDYETAARYYLAYLARNMDDATAIYNLACCYGLMSEGELAGVYLMRAVAAGFDDLEHILADRDFGPVKDDAGFLQYLTAVQSGLTSLSGRVDETVVFEAGVVSECLVRLPEGYDPEGKYPLVVFLHGYGDSPESFCRVWGLFETPGFIMSVPRAPYTAPGDGWSWFAMGGVDAEERADSLSVQHVFRAVNALRERYNVSRTYLMGFSQGASMALLAGLSRPEELAALVAISGRMREDWLTGEQLEGAAGLPVLIVHGERDRVVDVSEGRTAAELLEESGVDVTLYEWGGGHTIDAQRIEVVQDWLADLQGGRSQVRGTTQMNSRSSPPVLTKLCRSPGSTKTVVPGPSGAGPSALMASPLPDST